MKLIPLFPLEIVVFPFEALNLHIFEPRYKDLILDCKNDDITFGIPFHQPNHPMKYGTIVELSSISRTYSDGRMDVKTKGLRPFEVKRYVKKHPGKSYPGGYIEELFWEKEGEQHLRLSIRNKIQELYDYMNITKWPKTLEKEFISFEIAHKVGFNKDQEYRFLQISSEVDRQKYMLDHLNRMVPLIKQAEEMRQKVQMNGHFKDLKPPNV